jgi:hypothetical protein
MPPMLHRSMLDLLPTPARLYIEALTGKEGTITEANFTPEELDAMRNLVAGVGGGTGGVGYDDYQKVKPAPSLFNSPLTTQPGLAGLLTAHGRVANSLGQFNYETAPDGGVTITDNYDFNPYFKNDSLRDKIMYADPLHLLGEYLRPPGTGRPVRVKLK